MRAWKISAVTAIALLLVVSTFAVANAMTDRSNNLGFWGPGMGGYGLMGGYDMMGTGFGSVAGAEPIALGDARAAVQEYLDRLDDDNLAINEVMVFENQAYAKVVERDTGIGAFEVLVDPVTGAVYPEPGPNMMWNLKYSGMGGYMGYGMMMGGYGFGPNGIMGGFTVEEPTGDMPVTVDEAIQTAQSYLDAYVPGTEAEDTAVAFYGYYTIHVLRDGEPIGMLSVNGYTQQVFAHHWHGDFVEGTE